MVTPPKRISRRQASATRSRFAPRANYRSQSQQPHRRNGLQWQPSTLNGQLPPSVTTAGKCCLPPWPAHRPSDSYRWESHGVTPSANRHIPGMPVTMIARRPAGRATCVEPPAESGCQRQYRSLRADLTHCHRRVRS
jgi:hypothetical protein